MHAAGTKFLCGKCGHAHTYGTVVFDSHKKFRQGGLIKGKGTKETMRRKARAARRGK